ncbi:MAG: sigma-70 family RNA polymerase sigma factor, partial [Planctomycetia bacterium]|nr:sigma-70 family RNA polymerase sigma factor [Planctomycetia bacterium]
MLCWLRQGEPDLFVWQRNRVVASFERRNLVGVRSSYPMAVNRYRRPSDYVLIGTTQEFFLKSLEGKVDDPVLLQAWRKFFRRYDPLIRRFATSRGIRGQSLEDVVQNAWAIIIRDLREFVCDPSKGRFRTWLFVRVRNTSVDVVRAAERRHEICVGVNFDRFAGPDPPADQMFEKQRNDVVLDEAMRQLEHYVSPLDYKLFR